MTSSPLFSIITSTYQRRDLLIRAVRSAQCQTFKDYEHLIVDDGNDPAVAEMIRKLDDPKIRYFAHPLPMGGAAALNTGIRNARGEFISILDDDDEFFPEILEKTHNFFEQSAGDVGFIWTGILRVRDTETGEEVVRKEAWSHPYRDYEARLMVATSIGNGFGVTIRKRCFENTGYYDETLPVGFDTDMFMRLTKDYAFGTIPSILVKIHYHGGAHLTNPMHIAVRKDCYHQIIKKNRRFLEKHWITYYIHTIALVQFCYSCHKRGEGRKALLTLLLKKPQRLIVYADIVMYLWAGKDLRSHFPDHKITKYLIHQTGFRYD